MHIVDAVRHQATVGEVTEIMIEHRLRRGTVALPGPVQGAERFLLLGVDGQYGIPRWRAKRRRAAM